MSWANFGGEEIDAPTSDATPIYNWDVVIDRLVKAMYRDNVPERKIAAYFGKSQTWVRQIAIGAEPALKSA
jgi:hypothetical protein